MARQFARRAGPKRRTHWTELRSALVTVTDPGVTLLASVPVGHEGETLVRTRGLFVARLTAAASVGDGYFGAFGMCLVTSAAAAQGSAAVPTPLTEAGWDGWFVHRYFDVHSTTGAGGSSEIERVEIDSKAMRKANEDETLIMVVELLEDGVATVAFKAATRILSMVG